ncbi:MAG: glycosyltransferase family 2 protein [Bacteroidales bacterium]|nr:glycosyltransferase family 2 protein [Bacteroidales bacterium]
MRIALVILNWNTRGQLARWLPSLISGCEGLDAEVIVADNASTDGSMQMLTENFPQIRQIVLDRNYGFTGGYNRALERVEAEYYVLVNSDIEVSVGWLSPLVDWMDGHPECGICGPKLLSMKDPEYFEYAGAAGGLIDRFGFPFCRGRFLGQLEKDLGQYDTPGEVSWVSGACLMIRSSLWKEMGGLDDRFFAHMEEIDLCWRVRAAGYTVNVIPQSSVRHLGGGTLPQSSPFKLFLNYRNNLLMLDNNLPEGLRYRITVRRILDICLAFAYICCGKVESAKAVFRAHKEYRALRRPFSPEGKVNILSGKLLAFEYLRIKFKKK